MGKKQRRSRQKLDRLSLGSNAVCRASAPAPQAVRFQPPPAADTTVPSVEHNCTLQPPPAPTYADAVRANIIPSPRDRHNRTAPSPSLTNVAGTDGSGISDAGRPSLQSSEIAICSWSSEEDADLHFLHAVQQIPADADFEKEEVPIIIEICLQNIGCPKSIQNLAGFLRNNPLAELVGIFDSKTTILCLTPQGRILMQSFMAVVSECHSRNKTCDGTFDLKDIRIITTRQSKKLMMILKDPVKLEGETLLQAKLNDLRRAAKILLPLYRTNNGFPVCFVELKDDLEGATRQLVSQPRFMEYLRYHPAIMASAGRSKFAKALSSRPTYRGRILGAITGPYHNDWRTVVNSEMQGNADIDVLTAVYHHKPGTSYGRTMGELARFIRNILVHGKEHKRQDGVVIYYDEHELELYLLKIFTPFLPSIMRTLLISGKMEMEQLCGDAYAWPSYKLYV